jgi:ATP-dependent RNA helicase SUPV3L1/SUV3
MSKLVAILGPTNTGKTYLAMERLRRHATGMMGFPLRLLARENYDRLCKEIGPGHVALITGEERILPPKASYFICTVEAMPLERKVDFIGIDEVQLAADAERGHAFTDRILNARGRVETVFVGALTIQPLLERMFPEIEVITRPRFSQLTYSGYKKLTKLPKRTAVIAFSADDVYRMAELVRARHGGAAVVMGALSPRTRNAQVGLYQSGEVDTIVATDAIGMGLNMNIDHIAFARLSKFDGQRVRPLRADEVGQIAGRAGRHTADGTFGGTEAVEEMPEDLVQMVESHTFPPLTQLMWRNHDLDFASPPALLRSLDEKPPFDFLRRPQALEDVRALTALLEDGEVKPRLASAAELFTLWEVCQIPDFEKLLSDSYLRFLKQLFLHLTGHHGQLPTDWVAEQVSRIDESTGEIDTLTTRLGRIRTWTYIANRGGWLQDSAHWQQKARSIEDRLSDALHDKLTERFVERRAGIGGRGKLFCYVTDDNNVMIDGQRVGWFNGFVFNPDHEAKTALEERDVLRTIRPALMHKAAERAARLLASEDNQFTLNNKGEISWQKIAVGRLLKGGALLKPSAELTVNEWLEPTAQLAITQRLRDFVKNWFAMHLGALLELPVLELTAPARGVVFQLIEALGSLQREDVASMVEGFAKEDRIALGQRGVHLGSHLIWIDKLWTPEAMRARALLWALWNGAAVPPPPQGKSLPVGEQPKSVWHALGYSVLGGRAVRADVVEEFIPLLHQSPAPPAENLARNLGLSASALPQVLKSLGYMPKSKPGPDGSSVSFYVKKKTAQAKAMEAPADPAAFLRGAWGG